MVDIAKIKAENASRWSAMVINGAKYAEFSRIARRIVADKARYKQIEAATGVPWPIVGVIHYRESGLDFSTYLGNGQPLGKRTTQVPAGRGPFYGGDAFYRGCIDALEYEDCHAWTDWSVGGSLTFLDKFNGLGYDERGMGSPYLFSGTNQYARGKYIKDHDFDPNEVDVQEGCAPILSCMAALDPGATLGRPPAPAATSWLQTLLSLIAKVFKR